jgi:hypothetical protein
MSEGGLAGAGIDAEVGFLAILQNILAWQSAKLTFK